MHPLTFVIESLFPTRCVSCREGGDWWCAACRTQAGYVFRDPCASCASLVREHSCERSDALDGLTAAGFYHARTLRDMLQALKYHGVRCVLPSVRIFFHEWKEQRLDPWPWVGVSALAIQHLPAAVNRVRERGFDQAIMFTEIVCQEIVPWAVRVDLLVRSSSATTQASLVHGSLRDANIRGAFSIHAGSIVPSEILLVDDVVTTGSTMREAARILRAAGAQKVYGIAFAVGA